MGQYAGSRVMEAPMTKALTGYDQIWPALPLEAWVDTCQTLQLWTQIVGKIRNALTPWVNHSWHVVLYVSERGLSTSLIAYENGFLTIEFDFIDHVLSIRTSSGAVRKVALQPQSVAEFYRNVISALADLGITIRINEIPSEFPNPVAFSKDQIQTHTMANTRIGFGAFFSRCIVCFQNSVLAFWESVVRYISFGAVWIWR